MDQTFDLRAEGQVPVRVVKARRKSVVVEVDGKRVTVREGGTLAVRVKWGAGAS